MVALGISLALWRAIVTLTPRLGAPLRGRSWSHWFALNDALSSLAILALFAALEHGRVSVVSPIVATQPLLVIVLSAVLLRDVERITGRITQGGVATVVGGVLIAIAA